MSAYDIVIEGKRVTEFCSVETDDVGHIFVDSYVSGEGPSMHYDSERRAYVIMSWTDGGLFAGGILVTAEVLEKMRR